MTGSPLSREVVEFVQAHVTSLLQLEALLLVFEGRAAPRTATDLAAEMYVPEAALTGWLDAFATAGFCMRLAGGYTAPADSSRYAVLGEVAEAYVRRPVSVGRLVFGSSRDQLVELSDAFRLRKDG